MRTYDEEESTRIGAEPWQIDLLKMNPEYVSWGPHEDYMCDKNSGWRAPCMVASWKEMWGLNDLNECANFYFEVDRDAKECPDCGGNGYHPEAQEVVNGFYSHMNNRGENWHNNITQDEVVALVDAGRLWDFTRNKPKGFIPMAKDVNSSQERCGLGGHDAINRSILTETRLKRLGIPKICPTCEGHGHVFTDPHSHVKLILWMLHPRKGASRGVEVRISQEDLPDVFAFLKESAQRNAQRFEKIP
jgi:hypothetical protein